MFLADGSIERYKVRIVAKGVTQQEGVVDYFDTFSPVANISTIRVLVALVVAKNWSMHQMDVNIAFLHGDLHDEVYMLPPKGYDCPLGKVLKLNKSPYR